MRTFWRDGLATLFVAAALGVYGAWAIGSALPGFTRPTVVAVAVLVLGIAASVSAVVPGFEGLLHGSRPYLAATSAIGLIAFAAGLYTLFAGNEVTLGALVTATVVLWAVSTVRHVAVIRPTERLGHQ